MVIRTENAAKRSPAQYARDFALGMKPGCPDLWVCFKRRSAWLELKELGKSPTAQQLDVHAELRARGEVVLVGIGTEHAIEQLQRWEAMNNA